MSQQNKKMASALSDSEKLNCILDAVVELKCNQADMKVLFERKLDDLKQTLMQNIDLKVSTLRDELAIEIGRESVRINDIITTIQGLQTKIDSMGNPTVIHDDIHENNRQRGMSPHYDEEHGIIVSGVAYSAGEDLLQVAQGIVDALGVSSAVNVVNTTRFPSYNDRPGKIKIVFSSTDDKVSALRNKMRLKNNAIYKDVYIQSCKTHIERLIEQNMRTILRQLPQGQNYRVAANGRIQERTR